MKIRALVFAGVVAGCSEPSVPAQSLSPPASEETTSARPQPKYPAAKTLAVFFNFGSSKLTVEGVQVVGRAVQAVNRDGYPEVKITGHTDTVGTEPYNYELSARRAEVVRDAMVREGVYGRSISFEGMGKRNPLVQTGPGVREPQNRRVVIDLSYPP